jgi:ABC-2 type transport system ATP-binding protein
MTRPPRSNTFDMPAIALDHVSKTFGRHPAVVDVSLRVPEGVIYGFIGPNGSGKTTTLRMILNIILPDQGTISVLGQPPSGAARDLIGYLPEERGLYKKMHVRRLLRYYGQLKGRPVAALDPVITRWLDRLGLGDRGDARIDHLSKGMAQKVQFIAAVVAEPRLLILDEPFSGLDPVNAALLADAVQDLRRAGTTIVFSTHDMTTAERLCDRIFMIYRGRKVLDGSLAEIQANYEQDLVRVRLAAGAEALAGLPGIEIVLDAGTHQDVRVSGEPRDLLRQLLARTDVYHFEILKASLGDVFLRIAGPGAADPAELGAE